VGQTEAPLLIKPYVSDMTKSELMAIMVGGFATIAGGVMAAYVRFGVDAGHLMAASVMSAPAALVVAKIMYPETEDSKTKGSVKMIIEKKTANVVDAAAGGAADGLRLALNVGAMLLAFIALIGMINFGLSKLDDIINLITFHQTDFAWDLSLKKIFGVLFAPLSYCMGVDSKDIIEFGNLLGTKVSINELVAYVELTSLKGTISDRSFIIGTYALCGFANFSSIAIQIGGIGGIAPERRSDLAKIGIKAMLGGAIASWLTATIAGILI
jgi:CNT family concentrative nucleoside transporter